MIMKRSSEITLVAVLVATLAGCSQNQAEPTGAMPDKPGLFSPAKPAVTKITLPEGTRLHVALLDGISTTSNSPGDQFTASLVDPIVIDGKTIVAKGTRVRGRVTDVTSSGRVKGRASLRLILTSINDKGKEVSIETKPFVAVAKSTTKRDAKIVGGSAGVGALIGAIAGGGKGAAIGAAVGGGAGGGTVLATKGEELHYPPESKFNFTLSSSVTL
jgi:hypothetical protein